MKYYYIITFIPVLSLSAGQYAERLAQHQQQNASVFLRQIIAFQPEKDATDNLVNEKAGKIMSRVYKSKLPASVKDWLQKLLDAKITGKSVDDTRPRFFPVMGD